MNSKMIAVAIAALMTVPALAAADQFTEETSEQIVEGHTVFTVLENKVNNNTAGWDIAGLVRDIKVNRGPNVAWFNDQWKTFQDNEVVRYPCGGYVIATWAGVDLTWLLRGATLDVSASYVESYYITDPNGFQSITDLYAIVAGKNIGLTSKNHTLLDRNFLPVWITEVQGVNAAPGGDDGVSNCAPITDAATHDTAATYHDGGDGTPARIYNFDLFGLFDDVLPLGSKQHGNQSRSATEGEVTGCEYGTEWECPDRGQVPQSGPFGRQAGDPEYPIADPTCVVLGVTCLPDDDAEGYSHPYNPQYAYDGQNHTHATSRLDVLFTSDLGDVALLGGAFPPAAREYVVYDTEASETDVHACNNGGFVNVDIAASCFGHGLFTNKGRY